MKKSVITIVAIDLIFLCMLLLSSILGGAVGAFLILMESPVQALVFIIFIVLLQRIEGTLIYPRVVGSSMGLPSLWVLAAVTLGGGIFGVAGMMLSVPVASTAYTLLRNEVNKDRFKEIISPEVITDKTE